MELTAGVKPGSRLMALERIFHHFDLGGHGYITREEIMALGQASRDILSHLIPTLTLTLTSKARRSLGHKGGSWDQEKNQRLLDKIDRKGNGRIDKSEFLSYFGLN